MKSGFWELFDFTDFCLLSGALSGPIPSPAGLIESTLDCIGNIEVETYTEMSLVGTVCHEIRRQYMRSKNAGEGGEKEGEKLGQGSEKWTIAWIKKCCCILSALCYCGDSLPPMQGIKSQFSISLL